MKKRKISVEYTARIGRIIEVEVPDDVTDAQLEQAAWDALRDEPALDVLAANGVVHCPPGRPGGYRSYQLVPRIPGDLYALSARIAGGNDFATEDTRALACAIAAHTPFSLDADLAAAAAAALDEYEGYARSGEQRVWTLDDVQRHVETWHHMLTWHRRAFAPQAVEGGAA